MQQTQWHIFFIVGKLITAQPSKRLKTLLGSKRPAFVRGVSKSNSIMERKLFDRICQVIDGLISQDVKPTTSNIITKSLFSAGGTLASNEREVQQVLKAYVNGKFEFDYTYTHNNKTTLYSLSINQWGVMCLGHKADARPWLYQCAMDRHPEEQYMLIEILKKTSNDQLMTGTFIPNNIEYLQKYKSA